MCSPVGPVLDDVVVIGDLDIVKVNGTKAWHFSQQELCVRLPARAASIGWPTLSLEPIPVERLLWRDHQAWLDFRSAPDPDALAHPLRERAVTQKRTRGETGRGFQERASRGPTGPPVARCTHENSCLPRRIAHLAVARSLTISEARWRSMRLALSSPASDC